MSALASPDNFALQNLQTQTEGLQHLTETLQKDMRDVAIVQKRCS
jgi:hypothetical protein